MTCVHNVAVLYLYLFSSSLTLNMKAEKHTAAAARRYRTVDVWYVPVHPVNMTRHTMPLKQVWCVHRDC